MAEYVHVYWFRLCLLELDGSERMASWAAAPLVVMKGFVCFSGLDHVLAAS
jgi:hypothetical protein